MRCSRSCSRRALERRAGVLVDRHEARYIDCAREPLRFAENLVRDVRERSETAMRTAHALRVCELAIQAQAHARATRAPR